MPQQSWANRSVTSRPRAEDRPEPIEAPVPFWSAVQRAAEDQGANGNEGGREQYFVQMLLERHRRIEELTGQRLEYSDDMGHTQAFGMDMPTDEDPYGADAGVRRQVQAQRLNRAGYEAQVEALRQRFPELAEIETAEQLRARADVELRALRTEADKAARSGWQGSVGSFVGGTGVAMIDTPNVITAGATGGLGAGRSLLTRMVMQGAAGAGAEVLMVPERARAAQEWGGPEYGGREALGDIVTGAIAPAGLEALGAGWRVGARQVSARFGSSADPGERGVADQLDRLLDDESALADAQDFDAARDALARGDTRPHVEPERDLSDLFPETKPTQPLGGVRPPQPTSGDLASAEYRGRQIWAGRFDPMALEVDPVRFQYKGDGDAEGVSGRLRGVERWDATASGKAIVYEDATGRLVVADGHQRRGLARRLVSEGWADEVQIDGYLFRARDGWTPREVRVVAALKNIREGSGAIMDAAKLFREAPQALRDRSLPITGEFIHQARQLASLSDDAFRAVVNGVIPERYGAILGEMAGERPELQADLVALLRKAQPGSSDGARALVQEAMLDDFIALEGVQQDLFGGLPREATVIARGQIRERVLSGLRRDEKLFSQLVKNADAIEAGGNTLARSSNEAALAIDRASHELVSRLSLRSGDMGDAFQAAARAVTLKETTPAAAARGIIQRIRQAVKSGEALEALRAETLNPSPPPAVARDAVKAFDTPGGQAQRAQLEPKPEEVAELEAAASAGLFDDLREESGLTRAIDHLTACAPGSKA